MASMTRTERRRRIHRRRRTYIRSEADFGKNLREINRLRGVLASGGGNAATTAALERRESASRRWVTGETTR